MSFFLFIFCFVWLQFLWMSTRMIFGRKTAKKISIFFLCFVSVEIHLTFAIFEKSNFQNFHWKVLFLIESFSFNDEEIMKILFFQRISILKSYSQKNSNVDGDCCGWLKELILHLKISKTAEFRNQNSRISWKFCVSSQGRIRISFVRRQSNKDTTTKFANILHTRSKNLLAAWLKNICYSWRRRRHRWWC